jgi:hypothetical protein
MGRMLVNLARDKREVPRLTACSRQHISPAINTYRKHNAQKCAGGSIYFNTYQECKSVYHN